MNHVNFSLPHPMIFIKPWCYVCECVILHGKRDFTNGINVGNQAALRKGDFLGIFKQDQCNHMGLNKCKKLERCNRRDVKEEMPQKDKEEKSQRDERCEM